MRLKFTCKSASREWQKLPTMRKECQKGHTTQQNHFRNGLYIMKNRDENLHDTLQFQSITQKSSDRDFLIYGKRLTRKEKEKIWKKLYYMGNMYTFSNLVYVSTYTAHTQTHANNIIIISKCNQIVCAIENLLFNDIKL